MERLPNGFELNIPAGCFPLSTDSMVLAWFARGLGSGRVLDLGSGCGTLGLLLCSQNARCHVTGVEIDPDAHSAALQNIARNTLSGRMESICADARQVPGLFAPGSFSGCISNPPYFSGGPAAVLRTARREDECSLGELMKSAAWALKFGGDFCLVHRPERLAELIARGAENGLEAKRLGLVYHRAGSSPALVLVQLRKGAKPGLKWEELVLHDNAGNPTALYREIYHIQED